ncbi:MAG: hypothetical protein JXX29_18955 [Deltaproteobacteria bacterium]|nr:hypothetical protein [Deltaproteobacteria bacterium]MBN2673766.1 hypothetical protein [Deltaproteobacteria bacterium]
MQYRTHGSLFQTTRLVQKIAVLGALPLFLSACITSPVWEYGETKAAKEFDLPACEGGLLDDGEDGNTQVIDMNGRDGYWFTFMDAWGSTMEKRRFEMSEGGYNDESKFAAHINGQLADEGDAVYAGMGFNFTNPKSPFDISNAKGIRFWAKGPGKIRFKITDRNTDPVGDRCSDCYNDFGVDIYLQHQWMRYTVPFSEMKQQDGWGDRAPSLDVEGTFAVQWHFATSGEAYDIWVDQVELVGCAKDAEQ